MQIFFASVKKKIIHFIYQSIGNIIGITKKEKNLIGKNTKGILSKRACGNKGQPKDYLQYQKRIKPMV